MTDARAQLLQQLLIEAMAHGKRKRFQGSYIDDIRAMRKITAHIRATADPDLKVAAQADLVTIEHTLHQILNYKGIS